MDGEERRNRRRINRTKLRRFAVLLFFAYIGVMMVSVLIHQEKSRAIQQEDFVSLAAQLEQARGDNEELERKISFAQTNAYVERVAREQFGYVKDGEIKFVADESAEVDADSMDGSYGGEPVEDMDDDAQDALPAMEDGYLPGLPEGLLDEAP